MVIKRLLEMATKMAASCPVVPVPTILKIKYLALCEVGCFKIKKCGDSYRDKEAVYERQSPACSGVFGGVLNRSMDGRVSLNETFPSAEVGSSGAHLLQAKICSRTELLRRGYQSLTPRTVSHSSSIGLICHASSLDSRSALKLSFAGIPGRSQWSFFHANKCLPYHEFSQRAWFGAPSKRKIASSARQALQQDTTSFPPWRECRWKSRHNMGTIAISTVNHLSITMQQEIGECRQKRSRLSMPDRIKFLCEDSVAGQRYVELVSKEAKTCMKEVGERLKEEGLCGFYLKNYQMYFSLVPVGFRWEKKTYSSLLYSLQLNRALSSMSQSAQDRRTKQEKKKEVMQKIKNLRRQHKLKKERMSEEDKMVWRLQKTNRKIAMFHQKLKKYDLPEDEASQHDPEIVTQEQLQALKKIGYKNKNYVPVGRRGIYGGTIQNMHMHWKKHETVQVDCHIFSKERIKSMAQELARLSGGIVIDIHQATTVILYRGKNYRQPKVLIPPNLLDKRKALFKSKYEQALDSLEEHARKVEKELAKLRMQKFKADAKQLTETNGSATCLEEKIKPSLEEDDEGKEASDDEGFDAWSEDEYELYEPFEGHSEANLDAELDFPESSELKKR